MGSSGSNARTCDEWLIKYASTLLDANNLTIANALSYTCDDFIVQTGDDEPVNMLTVLHTMSACCGASGVIKDGCQISLDSSSADTTATFSLVQTVAMICFQYAFL